MQTGAAETPTLPRDAEREPMLHRLIRFERALHRAGVSANPTKLIDLCRSFEFIDISNRMDFYAAARTIFVSRYDDLITFDRIFFEFWTLVERTPNTDMGAGEAEGDDDEEGLEQEQSERSAGEEEEEAEADDEEPTQTGYSAQEVLINKNIGQMSNEEIERARDIMAELVSVLATVRSRRSAATPRGSRLDLRRILRKNLVYGQDGVELVYRRRKIKKLKLMLLCDVSGSMERYSNFLIQFIYALRRELPAVDVGVFATQLTIITDLLDDRNVGESLNRVSKSASDWGGGTDIGASLQEFNVHYAREMLRSKTVMVILSDGWDRGDATQMHRELERIHRRVHKLIWLNPLLGTTGYEPLCRGIRTALPYMDYFLPAHNLESLAQLAKTLRAVWH
jgi:uncharacterized protein with von Willebrand factor type A (vWA) domain